MRARALAVLVLLALPAPAAEAARRRALTPFASCGAMLDYARAHGLDAVGTGWTPGPEPFLTATAPATSVVTKQEAQAAPTDSAAAGPSFSSTNVQEQGVDEPDVVKTDGKTIYAVAAGRLYAVDVSGGAPKLLDSLTLDEGYGHELLLDGDRLLVLQNATVGPQPGPIPEPGPEPKPAASRQVSRFPVIGGKAVTRLTEIDVSDPANLRLLRTERADGEYVAARMTGHTVRLVVASRAQVVYALAGATLRTRSATIKRRRRLVRRARLAQWRPGAYFRDRRKARARTGPLVPCSDTRRPERFSGLDTVTVLTIDMNRGLPAVDSDAIFSDAQVVYASEKRLYVATQRFLPPQVTDDADPPPVTTDIHEFDTSDPDETRYVGTAQVSGFLLNRFALSESDGVLRAATTEEPAWWGGGGSDSGTGSRITTFDAGTLAELGSVGGLGHGQRIYAVRFIGDMGYVVTFRRIDPLYTVDLSRPAEPRVRGELELAGYSAYLHPLDGGLLLGVGQDATPQGRTTGTQASLFDVSDPESPKRLASRLVADGARSDAEFDPHAFLYWPATKLAVLPVQIYTYDDTGEGAPPFVGAIGLRVTRDGIDEVGRVTHPSAGDALYPIRRAVVVGDRLFTLSDAGLLSSGLADLSAGPFVGFGP